MMAFHHVLDQRETDADSLNTERRRLASPIELFENSRLLGLGNPDPLVAHFDRMATVDRGAGHSNRRARWRVFRRILDQVVQTLVNGEPIGVHPERHGLVAAEFDWMCSHGIAAGPDRLPSRGDEIKPLL